MHRNRYLVCLFVSLLILMVEFSAHAFTLKDSDTILTSFNSAFYYQAGTNGYFKDTQAGGLPHFWERAEEIECVIDAYEWKSNAVCRMQITHLLNGFLTTYGPAWGDSNIYNDDIMWAVIAFARGGQDIGESNYCVIARKNFDACYARAWDSQLGGGLYWTTANASKNACVNGPAAIAACLLYQMSGDTNYLDKARNIYSWERAVLFNPKSGVVYDNIATNGVISRWSSTYNQGTFIGEANLLEQTNDAILAANFTMRRLTTNGILPEYGIAGNNSGFNAIFCRWMTKFIKSHNLQRSYEPWLQLNAAAAWKMRRSVDNLSWCQWRHPSPPGSNFHSWDCISSYEILQAVDASQ
ncbi:MAG TPA: glycoside hydrolase family 76 protein [Pseudomonadales bacterium]|nr:glycoside hydrolase family 76 protein [Pseudomonadales bacterium]